MVAEISRDVETHEVIETLFPKKENLKCVFHFANFVKVRELQISKLHFKCLTCPLSNYSFVLSFG